MRDVFRVKNRDGKGPIVAMGLGNRYHLVEPTGRHYCGITGEDLPNPTHRTPTAQYRESSLPARLGRYRINLCAGCVQESAFRRGVWRPS